MPEDVDKEVKKEGNSSEHEVNLSEHEGKKEVNLDEQKSKQEVKSILTDIEVKELAKDPIAQPYQH